MSQEQLEATIGLIGVGLFTIGVGAVFGWGWAAMTLGALLIGAALS